MQGVVRDKGGLCERRRAWEECVGRRGGFGVRWECRGVLCRVCVCCVDGACLAHRDWLERRVERVKCHLQFSLLLAAVLLVLLPLFLLYALCSILCALCCVLCIVCCVLCALYCVLCAVRCVLCALYCVLCAVYFCLCLYYEVCTLCLCLCCVLCCALLWYGVV